MFTTTTRVPAARASCRYLVATGWLLAMFEPTNTTRSLPIPSRYEQVVAAMPIISLSAVVLGAWHTRAALSMALVPMARTAFWAT